MNLSIAKQVADLLNSKNELVVEYAENKILASSGNCLSESIKEDEVVACIERKMVQWYQFEGC